MSDMASQGPPVPSYIFRGHVSPIHALLIFAQNSCLASGDSDGWIVIWSLTTKRPVAVWKGHDGGIMALKDWEPRRLVSHGRDHRLRIWSLGIEDLDAPAPRLPVDGADAAEMRQPWLLHSMSVNALNYCAFSTCPLTVIEGTSSVEEENCQSPNPILIAAANGLDSGGIDIFHLPSERRVCKLVSDKETQTGMVMALALSPRAVEQTWSLASGYESGHVMIHIVNLAEGNQWTWSKIMTSMPHSQPVLSLNCTLKGDYVFSSSADAVVAKFDMAACRLEKQVGTKHAGQQDIKVRDDSKIFATAGWDKCIRVYSVKTLKELAVLKWHQEGCYATAFAGTSPRGNGASQAQAHANSTLIKTAIDMLRNEQAVKAQNIHWLAAGGKDGKISLWDIY